jgi:hypothetical protein
LKKNSFHLTKGSLYEILSLGERDNLLRTRGTFEGFASLGLEDIGICIRLDKKHGKLAGRLRIIPLNVVLAIDVISAAPEKGEEKKDSTEYV